MKVDYKWKISASKLQMENISFKIMPARPKKQRDICVNIIMTEYFAVLVMSDVQESILGY